MSGSGTSDGRLAHNPSFEERETLRMSSDTLEPYREAVKAGEYPNLSEALRAGLRAGAPDIQPDDEPASVQPANPGGVVRDE